MTEANKANKSYLILTVTVFPSSKKFKIIQKDDTEFEVYLKEEARNNLANKALLVYLSEYLGISKSQLQILTGHKKAKKKLKLLI